MSELNVRQKSILKRWRKLLRMFIRREWVSVLVWAGLGALVAGLTHLVLRDFSFRRFLAANYLPSAQRFDEPRAYFPYLITIGLIALLGAIFRGPAMIWRGVKSWREGVTSGLGFLSFTLALIWLTLPWRWTKYRVIVALGSLACSFSLSFVLHLWAQLRGASLPREEDFQVPSEMRSLVGRQIVESDDPIQTWEEDALGRASLVDSISTKLMISKSPVIALFGELGSGKTSILNLLRAHLADKAIVISFSTWLPGSQETLTTYLLDDIASECQKVYFVPGLRKSMRQLAKALAQNVAFLRSYLESLPATTQRDDINSLRAALSRLPRRVVVLLDELDRMEREELLTLLKVIRGVSALPNLSFVCATDRNVITKTLKPDAGNSQIYFEKFFPVSIQIPTANPAALRKVGVARLVTAFNRRDWFESKVDMAAFYKQIENIWDRRIAHFCRNLRTIGLLANDVSTAAAPLRGEVDAVDLTLIEVLHRFKPEVYEVISRNSVALTGGEDILRGGSYYSDKKKDALQEKLLADIKEAAGTEEETDEVMGVLSELFPAVKKMDRPSSVLVSERSESEDDKRIYHPGIFPAFFRYELPDAIFSSVELAMLLRRIADAATDKDKQQTFLEALDSMEKGSPKRDDFLRKLANWVEKSTSLATGKALVHAAMKAADKYIYDHAFPGFAEAGHVLRIVNRVAKQITNKAERTDLLARCVLEAADDTMAFNIVNYLTKSDSDAALGVSFAELYPPFTQRMRTRYGPEVDPTDIDLATSDAWAFDLWGRDLKSERISVDPGDRTIQRKFWLRYIGNSRLRLAETFRTFFLPVAIYRDNPELAVENKIPIAELKKLYDQLPDDGISTAKDRASLNRLRRLLNGDFRNGMGIDAFSDRDNEELNSLD